MFLANYFDLKKEKEEMQIYFTSMDIDKDGELSFEELSAAYYFKVNQPSFLISKVRRSNCKNGDCENL
jgi:Ca2+-binding EF-hand superfamily protein